jgi:hypothetical protein
MEETSLKGKGMSYYLKVKRDKEKEEHKEL